MSTTTAAAALFALLPATTTAAVPTTGAPAVASLTAAAAPVERAVAPVALAAPAGTAALRNAMSKLGSPYRWGAAGPGAFDCSGLVYWSFTQAGITLPRTSRAMSQVGKPVSKAQLQPGDLVFFYKPVSHVGIYVGGGKIVHASTAGVPVRVADVNRMPFNSARRV